MLEYFSRTVVVDDFLDPSGGIDPFSGNTAWAADLEEAYAYQRAVASGGGLRLKATAAVLSSRYFLKQAMPADLTIIADSVAMRTTTTNRAGVYLYARWVDADNYLAIYHASITTPTIYVIDMESGSSTVLSTITSGVDRTTQDVGLVVEGTKCYLYFGATLKASPDCSSLASTQVGWMVRSSGATSADMGGLDRLKVLAAMPPTNFQATSGEVGKVTLLTWGEPAGDCGSPTYRIEWSPEGEDAWTLLVQGLPASTTTYEHTPEYSGPLNTVDYRIRAGYTNSVSAYVQATGYTAEEGVGYATSDSNTGKVTW